MAQNAYQLFKDTYNQAIADGLPTAVATAAAQSAMDDALRQQSTLQPIAQPIVSISGVKLPDTGPLHPGSGRLGGLEKRDS